MGIILPLIYNYRKLRFLKILKFSYLFLFKKIAIHRAFFAFNYIGYYNTHYKVKTYFINRKSFFNCEKKTMKKLLALAAFAAISLGATATTQAAVAIPTTASQCPSAIQAATAEYERYRSLYLGASVFTRIRYQADYINSQARLANIRNICQNLGYSG